MGTPNYQLVGGVHAVVSLLDSAPESVRRAWVEPGRHTARLQEVLQRLASLGVATEVCAADRLTRMVDIAHQGIVVEARLPLERDENELLSAVRRLGSECLLLVLDHVQDPHNLGACMRTADAVGCHGIVVAKDQSARLTATVCKVASGAATTVPMYRVTNLARTLGQLKEAGVWVCGADGAADGAPYDRDLTGPLAIALGAEGSGLRRLTRDTCDYLVRLPMLGRVQSLNVSVAAGVLLYEVLRQRNAATSRIPVGHSSSRSSVS